MTSAERARTSPRVSARLLILIAVVVASVSLCVVCVTQGWVRPDTLQRLAQRAGPWAVVSYIAGVIVMELLWMPRMWSLLAAGVLFGPLFGASYSLMGDLAGAALCFAFARGLGRDAIAASLAKRPRAQQIVELFASRRGFGSIAVLRVCPVAHYTLVSYAAGLGGVPFGRFMLGTLVGILPGAIVYPLAGGAALKPRSPLFIGSLAVMGLFLIVTLLAARRMLKKEADENADPIGRALSDSRRLCINTPRSHRRRR